MARQVEARQSNTYPVELAQLPATDYVAGGRSPMRMEESPQSGSGQRTGGFQLARLVDSLDNAIPLPDDLRSFLVYFGILLVVAGGMMMHVLLSAQILQAEVELANMQNYHTVVKRQNGELLWRIGRATNLAYVQDKARAAGYMPIDERQYVEAGTPGATGEAASVGSTPRLRGSQAQETMTQGRLPARPAESASGAQGPSAEYRGAEPDPATTERPASKKPVAESSLTDSPNVLQQWWAVLYPRSQAPSSQPAATRATDGAPAAGAGSTANERSSNALDLATAAETTASDGEPEQSMWIDQVWEYITALFARSPAQ